MKPGQKTVKVEYMSDNSRWFYYPNSRCGTSPNKLFAQSPYMAIEQDFDQLLKLEEMIEGEEAFVETIDFVGEYEGSSIKPTHKVWRKAIILGPAIYPGPSGGKNSG